MTAYASKFQLARSSGSTDSSFPSKVPTTTAPTGTGVISDPLNGNESTQWIQVVPFGEGADNSTFDLRVISWKPTTDGLWVPTILAQAACTLSATVGVNGADVTNTQRFADTIALTQVQANVDSKLSSPVGDLVGSFLVETRGSTLIEITFDLGSATAANALVAWV